MDVPLTVLCQMYLNRTNRTMCTCPLWARASARQRVVCPVVGSHARIAHLRHHRACTGRGARLHVRVHQRCVRHASLRHARATHPRHHGARTGRAARLHVRVDQRGVRHAAWRHARAAHPRHHRREHGAAGSAVSLAPESGTRMVALDPRKICAGALETTDSRSVPPTTVGAKSAVVATVVLSLGILAL